MNNYSLILIENQQKHQHYHQDKYEYLTSEEILPSDPKKVIEQISLHISIEEKL